MKSGEVKVTFDGLKKFQESMRVLAIKDVFVGIPSDHNERKEDEEQEMNNATIGYINENGSDVANIPPRPHLIPGVRAVQKEIAEEFKKAAQVAFSHPEQVEKFYIRAGIIATNSVKKYITDQTEFVALSARTLKDRKEQGFEGEKALIRTGQYRNAITFVVGDSVKGKK